MSCREVDSSLRWGEREREEERGGWWWGLFVQHALLSECIYAFLCLGKSDTNGLRQQRRSAGDAASFSSASFSDY